MDRPEHETVAEPTGPEEQACVETLLRIADIPFMVANEGLQNLFGVGQIGGYNHVVGPIRIEVPTAHAQRARQIIAEAIAVPKRRKPTGRKSVAQRRSVIFAISWFVFMFVLMFLLSVWG